MTGDGQLLPRPVTAPRHRYPENDDHFTPITSGGHYRPRPADYPTRPETSDYHQHSGSKTRPKYPTYAGTQDYSPYPESSSQHSYPPPDNYLSRPGSPEYPSDRPRPSEYPALFRPGGGETGQAHLQEIGEVDISGLVSPPAGYGVLPDRPTGCPAAEHICGYDHSGYPR